MSEVSNIEISTDEGLKGESWIKPSSHLFALIAVLCVIGWISFSGVMNTEMCMDKFETEDDNDSILTLNIMYALGLGFSIGSIIVSGIPDKFLSIQTRYGVALASGIVATIAAGGFANLDNCQDNDKIRRNKEWMYVIIGIAIGVFVTGLAQRSTLDDSVYYGTLFVVSCLTVIAFTSASINMTDRCLGKAELTEIEKDKMSDFRTLSIILLVIVLIALIGSVLGVSFQKGWLKLPDMDISGGI